MSEKSLELNIGAELLGIMRNQWGKPKAYLRGLTQREERQEGVDFFAQLDPAVRIFAFQFKAPIGRAEGPPYRYTLKKYQHRALFRLARAAANSVFYVLPFYLEIAKLQQDVPNLATDTWLLSVDQLRTADVFGAAASKVVSCTPGQAAINPEYRLLPLSDVTHTGLVGIRPARFARWYRRYRQLDIPRVASRRNPWLARGLRIAVVLPSQPIASP